ncbi:MAG: N-acetylneuraminate synthase family protein [Vicinamibacterales bacterium]
MRVGYPTPMRAENLRAIATLARTFDVPVRLSDHGADGFALPLAIALGATLYERHVMLHANDQAIDAPVSSTAHGPGGLRAGGGADCRARHGRERRRASQSSGPTAFRAAVRSCERALHAGRRITPADIIALRPGSGLPADRELDLIGRVLPRDVPAGAPFLEGDLVVQHQGASRVA